MQKHIGHGAHMRQRTGLSFVWISVNMMSIGPSETNFNNMNINMPKFSFKKMHLTMSPQYWSFCSSFELSFSWDGSRGIFIEMCFLVQIDPESCYLWISYEARNKKPRCCLNQCWQRLPVLIWFTHLSLDKMATKLQTSNAISSVKTSWFWFFSIEVRSLGCVAYENVSLFQIMIWRRTGDKLFSKPMMTHFGDIHMQQTGELRSVT